MWVKFLDNFSFKPTMGSTIDYKRGLVQNVTTPCGEKAIAAGKAEALSESRKALPRKAASKAKEAD